MASHQLAVPHVEQGRLSRFAGGDLGGSNFDSGLLFPVNRTLQ